MQAKTGARAIDTDMPIDSKFGALPARRRHSPSAFLTVQEGCDKFCTYCVVPYTRGAEVSRGWSAILDEARLLVDLGARELTLLGQNVNAWRGEDPAGRVQGLDGLIESVVVHRREITFHIARENLVEAARRLRDDESLRFEF